jgi:thiamine transport system permease protein
MRIWRWSMLGIVMALLVGAFVAPLAVVMLRGLSPLTADSYAFIWRIVQATLWQATLSTVVALVIAIGLTWAMVRRPGRLADISWLAVIVPFIVPTPVAATMATGLCGTGSWCATLFGLEVPQGLALIVAVHVWFNTGVLVRLLREAWFAVQGRILQAAATLGASPWRQFVTVTWPLMTPAVWAGMTLVLLYCIGSFGVILLLGGGRVASIEVEIWRQTAQFLRLDLATVMALVQLGISVVLLILSERWQRRIPRESLVRPQSIRPGVGLLIALGVQVVCIVLFVMPFVVVFARSLMPQEAWWQAFVSLTQPVRGSGLFVSPLEALWRSLWIATIVAGLTLVCAWTLSAPGWWRVVATLPIGVSAVTLGLGYLLWFGPMRLLQTPWVLLAAHVVLALPLVSRQLMTARDRLPDIYQHAAATLGAAPWRQWWSITVPLLRRSLVAAGLVAFAVSLGDFAAGLLLTQPDTATAPIMVGRLLGRPGALQYAMAAALSSLLVVVCVVVMLVVQRLERDTAHRVLVKR